MASAGSFTRVPRAVTNPGHGVRVAGLQSFVGADRSAEPHAKPASAKDITLENISARWGGRK